MKKISCVLALWVLVGSALYAQEASGVGLGGGRDPWRRLAPAALCAQDCFLISLGVRFARKPLSALAYMLIP